MTEISNIPIIVVLGPTATGKSDLAVNLALWIKKEKPAGYLGAEIISADSRQVYKGLDIGTGKITKKEKRGIKHYLLDVAKPNEQFSVIDFVKLAKKAISEINGKNKIPIVCGGTGFYIEALIDGVYFPDVPPNNELRAKLRSKKAPELLEILKKMDPERSITIDGSNSRRIIRAIEIATALGKVPHIEKHPDRRLHPIFIGLSAEPDVLRERIRRRLSKRLKHGMIEEIRGLHKKGLSWKRMEELGLEYRYIARYLEGKMTREEMEKDLETEIWRYAKRQMTWFKRDKRINWLEIN